MEPGPDRPAAPWSPDADRRATCALTERIVRSYGDALRDGRPRAAAAVIDQALAAGLSAVEIQSRVIAPAMWWIGELWQRGVITPADEHLATAVSHQMLARLYPGLLRCEEGSAGIAVVAAVQGDHHVLGLRMVADVLDGAGYEVRFLGADVPATAMVTLVEQHRPDLVALGVTMAQASGVLGELVAAIREVDPAIRVILGGPGVPPELRTGTETGTGTDAMYIPDTEHLFKYARLTAGRPAEGRKPPTVARGGVRYSDLPSHSDDASGSVVARLAQNTAAAADATRREARRAFALEQLAFRDSLTGLWNRRAFDDRYQALLEVQPSRAPAVLMIDVDHFKAVNDGFGHDVGDQVLIGVANCVMAAIRADDFAARLGGDEFVVLLPETTQDVAAAIGERIRSLVEAELTDPMITVSIGVLARAHTDRRRATIDADRALYEAKEGGRNRVALA